MKNLLELVESSKNMVEVESVILTKVSEFYMNLFSMTERKFIRKNETQQNWIDSVWVKYSDKREFSRKLLFKHIPERFRNSIMYKSLDKKINSH